MSKRKSRLVRCPQCRRPRKEESVCLNCVAKNAQRLKDNESLAELIDLFRTVLGKLSNK